MEPYLARLAIKGLLNHILECCFVAVVEFGADPIAPPTPLPLRSVCFFRKGGVLPHRGLVGFPIARFFWCIRYNLPILTAELFSVSPPIIELPPSQGVVTRQALTNEVPNKRHQVAQTPHQKFTAILEAGSAHRGF